jgi:hypothetical protein
VRVFWRSLNLWFRLALLWAIVWGIVLWTVIDRHAAAPGPYNAPHKVAVRKKMLVVQDIGFLLLAGLGAAAAPKDRKREREEK